MQKRQYINLISFLFLILFCIVTLLVLKNSTSNNSGHYFFKKSGSESNLKDSVRVIEMNKIAYSKRLSDPQVTIDLADSALNLAKSINYIPGIAEAHRVMGIGYYYFRSTEFSIKHYMEALKYFNQLKDIRNQAKIYNNIGNLYRIYDHNKALAYYKKSLALAKSLKNDELTAGLYFNIATVYQRKRNYKESLIYFEKSIPIFTSRRDTSYMIMYLQNTGMAFFNLNDIDEAESRLIEAVYKAKMQDLPRIITGAYLILASIYIKKEDYPAAQKLITEGIQYSKILKDTYLEYDFIHTAYELESKRKNYQKALSYLKLVYKHDSLLLSKNQSENIGITSKHYLQQQKLQENKLTIAKQKYSETVFWWIITIIISFVMVLIILGFVRYFYLLKKRKIKELIIESKIAALEQKALQAMMNPHFLFNIMASIQYFINKKDNEAANQVLTGFAKLMRKHLEICMNSSISLEEEIEYLSLYLSLEKIRFADKMDYNIIVSPEIEADEITIPSMLIQPFIENAIWHGIMPKEQGGLIKVEFSCQNSDLLIRITDNGIGISNSKKSKTGGHISRGLELIQERVTLLNKLNKNQIQINQHQTGEFGTMVLISIPA